jgi:hypothetical protein
MEVMMLVSPALGIANLVGIGGARENLSHERVRVKRDARNQLVELALGVGHLGSPRKRGYNGQDCKHQE